jgi:hypothetical protein
MSEEQKCGTKYPEPGIVGKIISVTYSVEKTIPPVLVLDAVGEVPTGGFTGARLERVIYVMPPEDGIQDYMLFAVPPAGMATQVISEIRATNRWPDFEKEAPGLKGIRVHGVGNGVRVETISESQ